MKTEVMERLESSFSFILRREVIGRFRGEFLSAH